MFKGQVQDGQVPQAYKELVEPHVGSFDYFLSTGVEKVVQRIKPIHLQHPLTKKIHTFYLANPVIGMPSRGSADLGFSTVYPRECRESKLTYGAQVDVDFCFEGRRISKRLGELPIMVKSSHCHLKDVPKSVLFKKGEEANDFGGYFVAGGLEKCVRMIIHPKRHYIMASQRGSYTNRGAIFTDKATMIRCVRDDEFGVTIRCHYLQDGTVSVCLPVGWMEYFVPAGIFLKALREASDREIFDHLVSSAPSVGSESGMGGHPTFVAERSELLLQQAMRYGIKTRNQCIEYLGSHFRVALGVPSWKSDSEAGLELLEEHLFPHLTSLEAKFDLLIEMIHKLYAFVNSLCCADNADGFTTHEIMLPGIFFAKCMNEVLNVMMESFGRIVQKDLDNNPEKVDLHDQKYLTKALDKCGEPCRKIEMMLKTGRFVTKLTRDLGQVAGFTVMAERINFNRFLAHFRAFHRGAIFVEMKTTSVRKLLPESWGFVCPVHTPDGTPCGLLLHLTADCKTVTKNPEHPQNVHDAVKLVLTDLGMVPLTPDAVRPPIPFFLPVTLEGKLIGHVDANTADSVVKRLRCIKSANLVKSETGGKWMDLSDIEELVPKHMEIAYFPFEHGGLYPGIFLFTSIGRPVRKVIQLDTNSPELIGPLEQSNMSIKCPDGGVGGSEGLKFTHKEVHSRNMLSILAGLTPFSDFNQSPRNMYQCQMAKQTMGTPCQDFAYRPENKMYRLQTPQTPICRSFRYDQFKLDEYMSGTNAVVAVLAFTGYDMEDAMILNRSSVDRGFAHGSVYKTEQVFLAEEKGNKRDTQVFGVRKDPLPDYYKYQKPVGAFGEKFPQNIPSKPDSKAVTKLGVEPLRNYRDGERIDVDGLPEPGAIIWPGQSYYSTVNVAEGRFDGKKLKGEEIAKVDTVTIVGHKKPGLTCANIKLRFNRNPVIGDKFASRAGQKGILSQKWPDINFPYCARTGIRPDLIINPHAFPSRMTIGMLVESLTSKSAALVGKFVDCSPFQKCDNPDVEYPAKVFGDYLEKAGFHREGTETMINGITGEEMPCDIYIGCVYYQRLRHMVSDKFQCRSTGPINSLTGQPVKGRKAGGGIRLGEMERDSLIAHGAAYTLHDRLNTCSDYGISHVCGKCGSILGPYRDPAVFGKTDEVGFGSSGKKRLTEGGKVVCPMCDGSSKNVVKVPVPTVFKLLTAELAAMNIKIKLDVKSIVG